MMEFQTGVAVACVFLLAGGVKGVVGLGLPTVSMALLSVWVSPALAAAWLVGTGPVYPVVGAGRRPRPRRRRRSRTRGPRRASPGEARRARGGRRRGRSSRGGTSRTAPGPRRLPSCPGW